MYYIFLIILFALVYFSFKFDSEQLHQSNDSPAGGVVLMLVIVYLMIPCINRYSYKSMLIEYNNYDAKIKVLKEKQLAVENFLLSIKMQPGYLYANDSPYKSAIDSKLQTEKELADINIKKIELKTDIEYAPKSFFGVWIKAEKI